MSNRDTSQDLVSDETATEDIGGAWGGPAGTMPDANQRDAGQTDASAGLAGARRVTTLAGAPRPDPDRDPNARGSAPAAVPLSYSPGAGTGASDHPMAQTDAGATSTARTDVRDNNPDADQGLGRNWTGETAPDVEARENPPSRGPQNSDANDAF